ncbi:MAG: 4Fe-4S binding protein [Terrimicrobiaceae bacterium]|nr:4Fe-4S binding protein [Terrimicrobiaceae bacterium]
MHKQGTDCGACAEHCPTGALTMVKNHHGVALPHVDENLCTGCGACQHACPVRPSPAIVVSGVYPRLLLPERGRQAPLPSREIPDFPF